MYFTLIFMLQKLWVKIEIWEYTCFYVYVYVRILEIVFVKRSTILIVSCKAWKFVSWKFLLLQFTNKFLSLVWITHLIFQWFISLDLYSDLDNISSSFHRAVNFWGLLGVRNQNILTILNNILILCSSFCVCVHQIVYRF